MHRTAAAATKIVQGSLVSLGQNRIWSAGLHETNWTVNATGIIRPNRPNASVRLNKPPTATAARLAINKTADKACHPTTIAGTEIITIKSINRLLPEPNGLSFRSAVGQKPRANERPAKPAAASAVITRMIASIVVAPSRQVGPTPTSAGDGLTTAGNCIQVTTNRCGQAKGTKAIATAAKPINFAGTL